VDVDAFAMSSHPRRRPGVLRAVELLAAVPALGGGCAALCAWEARRARQGPRPYERALAADALLGPAGPAVRVTWLGDSLAAGLGADDVADTPAHTVARMLERAVEVRVLAVPGARVEDVLVRQLPRLDRSTDLVVVSVGANDVAAGTSRGGYAARLDGLLAAVAPIPTIVLSLPDMAVPDRLAEPLRTLAGWRARWFEAARQRVVAGHPHVRSVDVASRPVGMSRRDARTHLCADHFHPGPLGYRVWAERIAAAAHEVLPPVGPPVALDGQRLAG
jgi:lysophospholipase L1-like esterase